MSASGTSRNCGKCGAELNASAVEGLCLVCMLENGFYDAGEGRQPRTQAQRDISSSFTDYQFLHEIARGGMGVVFKAHQISLNRIVAVKMILAGRLANTTELARFRSEAQTAAGLQHPNIVAIHEVGEVNGQPFFSMDYVEGESLGQLTRNQPLPARRAAAYLKAIAEAVQYAHCQGVLHRDLKPSNILIDQNDQPRITDFGLAKRLEGMQLPSPDPELTLTGQVLGSPNFMSPEQAAGDRTAVGVASDVYSSGALLYQLLTGRPPFAGETLPQTLRLLSEADAAPPRVLNPAVPRDLETICLKCLQKDPVRRYSTAKALAEDLGRFLKGEPIRARGVGPAEKLWRWCRRNRALAGASGAVTLLLLTVALGSPLALLRIDRERKRAQENARSELEQRHKAEANGAKAEQTARLEAQQRARAEQLAEENRWNVYADRIKVAQEALEQGDVERTKQLLDSLRPQQGQKDLRGFDWYFLWQQYHSEKLSLPGVYGLGPKLAVSPDGESLATYDGVIHLYSLSNGVERCQFLGPTSLVHQIIFSPRDGVLASAAEDGTVRLWEPSTRKQSKTFQFATNSIGAIAFSTDGRLLAAVEGTRVRRGGNPSERFLPEPRTGRMAVWDVASEKLKPTIEGSVTGVLDLAFRPNSSTLLFSSADRRVRLVDAETGKTLAIRTNSGGTPFGVCFLPNGREIAEACWVGHDDSGQITILDGETLQEKRRFGSPAGKVLCLAVSPDGSKIASAGADCLLRLWETSTGIEQEVLAGHTSPILALAFSPQGDRLTSAGEQSVKVWDVNGPSVRQPIKTQNCFSVAFSPDGKLLACGGRNVEIREASTGKLLRVLPDYTDFDIRVGFSPDGTVLSAVGQDAKPRLWDTSDWRVWERSRSKIDFSGLAASSEDGHTLAVCADDSSVQFYNTSTQELLDQIRQLPEAPFFMGFSSDHTFLTGGKNLIIWELATKTIKRRLPMFIGELQLSRSGRWLGVSRDRGPVGVYELPGAKLHARFSGERDQLWGFGFSHDERVLATASWDGTVKLWHILSGQELLSIPSGAGVVWTVAFAPADRMLAFGCGQTAPNSGQVVILRAASSERADSPAELTALGRAMARAGRWSEAANVFHQLIQLRPNEHINYHHAGLIYAMQGDLEQYEAICRRLQTAFAGTQNEGIAERMAKTCLLVPGAQLDSEIIEKWIRTANHLDPTLPHLPYAEHVTGLWSFRRHDFEHALKQMRSVTARSGIDPSLLVSGWMITAMALRELHQGEEAHAAFSTGLEIERTRLSRMDSGDLGSSWNDRIIAHVLVREAQAVFQGNQ